MDLGNPASYLVLDGIIVDMRAGPGGHRFADATQVEAIYEKGVVLTVNRNVAEQLPEPSENPATLDADPADTAPDDLKDRLRRAWDYLSGKY